MFALAGVPPFAGFFGKYYIFLAVIRAKMVWLAIIGVLTSLVSAYYYLRLVVLMFFSHGRATVETSPPRIVLTMIVLSALLVLLFGLFPSIIIQTAQHYF
jgi:NADH-quinone oxidoreductase subunit N